MTSLSRALAAWPALQGGSLLPQIHYERGVWGKLPESRLGYRWIATTSAFPGRDQQLEKQLLLGSEDLPERATHWRSLGDLCLAMATYPSPSTDASGRSGFLEKQVFAWRRTEEIPAALGALALLPRVAQADAGIWSDRQKWMGDDDTLHLLPEDHESLQITVEELDRTVAAGLDELFRVVSEEALAELYAHLLAGHRAVPLCGLQSPLGPEALAALLLPLPRPFVDSLSLAGWLPSRRISGEIQSCWNAALAGASSIEPVETPTPKHQEQARRLAGAVFSMDPAQVVSRPFSIVADPGQSSIQLALWGPSSAGKTALLAQLYLNNLGKDTEWEADPDPDHPESKKFFDDMEIRMVSRRAFPPATSRNGELITYRFRHRPTGAVVLLRLEDRAGSESSSLTEPVRQHLAAADGLILLFDPDTQFRTDVRRTLAHLKSERRDRDDRPIAVCLSKADRRIKKLDDLQQVFDDPDGFVRLYYEKQYNEQHSEMNLLRIFDHHCKNYRFFPVSAAGVRSRYGMVESVVFYDDDLLPRIGPGGSTINVMEPFTWLLNQVIGRS